METSAANFTADIPAAYEAGLVPVIFTGFAKEVAERTAALKPAKVLETAAGTGIVTRILRDLLPAQSELVATDLNDGMLQIARGRFKAGEAITITPCDAQALPYGDGEFDVVVCQFGIMFLPDREKAFREAWRVLKPGGRFIFGVWDSHAENPWAQISNGLIHELFTSDPPGFYAVPFSCAAIDPLKNLLAATGFHSAKIEVLRRDQPLPDVAAFARGAIFGTPTVDQIRARGSHDPEKVVGMLTERFHKAFGAKDAKMPIQMVCYTAQKG